MFNLILFEKFWIRVIATSKSTNLTPDKNLILVEKTRALHEVEQNNGKFTTVDKICGIHHKTASNMWKDIKT